MRKCIILSSHAHTCTKQNWPWGGGYSGILVMCEALLGVEIWTRGLFSGSGILWWLFLGKRLWCGLFWRLTKSITQGSRFNGKQSYQFRYFTDVNYMQTSRRLPVLKWTFLGSISILGCWTFFGFGFGLPIGLFFGYNNLSSFAHSWHYLTYVPPLGGEHYARKTEHHSTHSLCEHIWVIVFLILAHDIWIVRT